MTPQQRAQKIYNKLVVHIQRYDGYVDDRSKFNTIQCALIVVDEIIKDKKAFNQISIEYWEDVKQEIEKL